MDTFWPAAYTFAAAGILDSRSGPVRADIDLAHGGSVSGVVVDSASGAPVTGAQVTATIMDPASSGPYGSAEPVEGAGRFAISGLPPVPMMLFVRLPPGSSYLSPPYGRGEPARGPPNRWRRADLRPGHPGRPRCRDSGDGTRR